MSERHYELRFEGLEAPRGSMSFRDLAALAESLQNITTRVARDIAGQTGAGRSTSSVERISDLRLVAIAEGSTTLGVTLGDPDALPAMPDEDQVQQRFEEIVASLATGQPPSWASPLISQAVHSAVQDLTRTGASRFEVRQDGRQLLSIAPTEIDGTVWLVTAEQRLETATVSGVLDRVDLRQRKFRVRDDIGNDVILDNVPEPALAARLIAERVIAEGPAERNEMGRVVRIEAPTLRSEALPEGWLAPPAASRITGGPVPAGIEGITDEDVEAFLSEIRS